MMRPQDYRERLAIFLAEWTRATEEGRPPHVTEHMLTQAIHDVEALDENLRYAIEARDDMKSERT